MESNPSIWEEIERSESYLVASMYEEAASMSSSVLNRICNNRINSDAGDEGVEGLELNDMMESAGMVLVQSLSQRGRAPYILKELKQLFMSVEAIPIQVLLTGACLQLSEGSHLGIREFLEEFLSKWHLMDGKYYVLVGAQIDSNVQQRFESSRILGVDEYMEVVEIYTMKLLGGALKNLDLAVAWVEKAALPDERRQGLLRRLHSLYSLKATNASGESSPANAHDAHFLQSKQLDVSEESPIFLDMNHLPKGGNNTKQAILKHLDPCFSWFRTINLKLGNVRLAVTNGKILLGCMVLLVYYVVRSKRATLKGIIGERVFSMKRALVDLWQLTFSYQVNPLAAVQPLPAAPRGGR